MHLLKAIIYHKQIRRKYGCLLPTLLVIFLVPLLHTPCAFSARQQSSINLGIEASGTDLAATINQFLPKELYKERREPGISVTVLRTGPVIVTATDNFVFFTIPVQVAGRFALYESYPLRTNLKFKAKVNVTPDWRLKTDLYYTGLSENLVDTFAIGPISLKPKQVVESIIQPIQQLLAPFIDDKINESIKLRAKVVPFWENAFSPILVSKEFRTWLKLTPERIVMSPMVTTNNKIRLSIGVISGTEMTVGPKPVAAPVKALPSLQQVPGFDKTFHIQLTADIFYPDLVTALNPVLIDKTFGDDKKITIRRIDLKGEGGRLVVTLTTSGDFEGKLTLFARPVYKPENNSLTFEDVDFDTRHTGWLLRAGSWLFSSTIRNTIKAKLDASLAEQLENARRKVSAALSSVQIDKHIKLIASLPALSLGEATVLNDRLQVHVIARGESSVILK